MALDSGEPFGLPRGTVRGLIALAFAGALIFMGVTGAIDVIVFVAIGAPAVNSYFSTRAAEPAAAPPEQPLARPSVPGDEGNAE